MFLLKFLQRLNRLKIADFAIVTLSIFLVSFLYLGMRSYRLNRQISIISPKITPTPTKQSSTLVVTIKERLVSTLSPAHHPAPTLVKSNYQSANKSNNQIEWGKTIKIDDRISASYFAPDDHMSTKDELNQAMNIYRQSHEIPILTFDSLLCQIAKTRAGQLEESGKLSHAGFSDLAQNQNSFYNMAEVIFGASQPTSGIHIVEWGWDRSLTGHHEAISDPKWNEGCGATAGFFAIFVFGKR